MDNLCFGMECLNITQLPGGTYSHANKAVDLGGKDTGKDWWFARGEVYWKCTCCWYSGTNTYHFLSCDKNGNPTKVHCADGVDRIVTISLTHDLNAPTIGKLYHNEKMYQEGTKYPTAGKVTGNHIHLEIAEGDVRNRYKANNGTWTLYNELNPLEVMFVDDSFTTIKSTLGATVKHCSSISYGGDSKMEISNGFQTKAYNGATLKIYKGYDKYKDLKMLSAKGTETSVQDIKNFDHNDMVIVALANCNYFEMANASTSGQHYGVEQSNGDGVHTSSLDLAPKNKAYQVVYELKNGTVGKCLASDYWYSKNDVSWACTPYSIVVWDKAKVNERSSAFGNKDAIANSQTMYMRIDGAWCIVATASKVLPSIMQSFAMECGADIAFLVDSGGSTQMMAYTSKWESIIYTGRHIPNVLALAYVKDSGTPEPTPAPDPETPSDTTDWKTKYEEEVKLYDELNSQIKQVTTELEAIKEDYNALSDKLKKVKELINE